MSTDVLHGSNIDDANTLLIIMIPTIVTRKKSFKKSIVETSRKMKTIVAFSVARLYNRKTMACLIRMYHFYGNIQDV